MAKIEDQRIVVWCNEDENFKQTILDAVYFAVRLEKEVCLFANYINDIERDVFTKRLSVYAEVIKKDIPSITVSTLLLKGKLSTQMKELGEKYNAILFCVGGKVTNPLLQAFYRSGFPFYFSKEGQTEAKTFKRIIIPIDFRNSTKESTLWGSYLGRFNQSEIVLLRANEKNGEQKQQVDSIVAFVKKFYSQFFFNYWVVDGKHNSWGIHREAIDNTEDFDLMIFTGSLNVSLADRLIGPFEKRLVNRSKIPVLLINPQKELFVLCT
jgi:hypothetical protein